LPWREVAMTTATEAGYVEMRIAKAVGLAPTEHELFQYVVLEEVAGDRHLAIEIGQTEAFSLAAHLDQVEQLALAEVEAIRHGEERISRETPRTSGVGNRCRRVVKSGHLGAVEVTHCLAHVRFEQVEDPQGAVAALGDRHDADEAVAVRLGEVGEGSKLALGVGEMVAVGVDDRRRKAAVITAGDDQEVDLEAGPRPRVVEVGNAERVGRGP
jgi:hypothetical protein